jgi:hypothetical protein
MVTKSFVVGAALGMIEKRWWVSAQRKCRQHISDL